MKLFCILLKRFAYFETLQKNCKKLNWHEQAADIMKALCFFFVCFFPQSPETVLLLNSLTFCFYWLEQNVLGGGCVRLCVYE